MTLPDYEGDIYDKYRPSYPDTLAEKLFSLTKFDFSSKLLEIGCGTGKGTEVLINNGAKVHGVEPNSSMAKIASDRFSDSSFSVDVCKFEDFYGIPQSYQLITSAHAFHWVDPKTAFSKCYELLRDGGALAVFRNNRKHDDEFSKLTHEIYVQFKNSDPHASWNEMYYGALADWILEFRENGTNYFHGPQIYEFENLVTYTTEEYLGLQETYWCTSWDKNQWGEYLKRTAGIIDSMGGKIAFPYTTIMYLPYRR